MRQAAVRVALLAILVLAVHGCANPPPQTAAPVVSSGLSRPVSVAPTGSGRFTNPAMAALICLPEQSRRTSYEAPPQPEAARQKFAAGFERARAGRTDAAERLMRNGVTLDDGNAAGHYYLAELLTSSGNMVGAGHHYQRTVALAPGSKEAEDAKVLLVGVTEQWKTAPAPPPADPVERVKAEDESKCYAAPTATCLMARAENWADIQPKADYRRINWLFLGNSLAIQGQEQRGALLLRRIEAELATETFDKPGERDTALSDYWRAVTELHRDFGMQEEQARAFVKAHEVALKVGDTRAHRAADGRVESLAQLVPLADSSGLPGGHEHVLAEMTQIAYALPKVAPKPSAASAPVSTARNLTELMAELDRTKDVLDHMDDPPPADVSRDNAFGSLAEAAYRYGACNDALQAIDQINDNEKIFHVLSQWADEADSREAKPQARALRGEMLKLAVTDSLRSDVAFSYLTGDHDVDRTLSIVGTMAPGEYDSRPAVLSAVVGVLLERGDMAGAARVTKQAIAIEKAGSGTLSWSKSAVTALAAGYLAKGDANAALAALRENLGNPTRDDIIAVAKELLTGEHSYGGVKPFDPVEAVAMNEWKRRVRLVDAFLQHSGSGPGQAGAALSSAEFVSAYLRSGDTARGLALIRDHLATIRRDPSAVPNGDLISERVRDLIDLSTRLALAPNP